MIEIQNGCTPSNTVPNTWEYTVMEVGKDRRDQVNIITHTFVAQEGKVPVIGDFIDGGKLVKRTEPKVNADWSRWKNKDLYGNP